MIDICHFGIACIRTVFLESETQYQYACILDGHTLDVHMVHQLLSHICAHTVVQSTGAGHHTRQDAVYLCTFDHIVWIDADAMAANQSGLHMYEIPFAGSGVEHIASIYAHCGKDFGQLVDKGYIDIALAVFDNFGGLGNTYGGGLVGTVEEHGVVEAVHKVGCLGSGARRDLDYGLDGVLRVGGVDALGAIADKEVDVVYQSRLCFQLRHADILGHARIDGGLVDDDVAF